MARQRFKWRGNGLNGEATVEMARQRFKWRGNGLNGEATV